MAGSGFAQILTDLDPRASKTYGFNRSESETLVCSNPKHSFVTVLLIDVNENVRIATYLG
jgi:hypothetical protein